MTTTTTTTTTWVADWLLAARRRNILSSFGQMNIFPGCWTPRTKTGIFLNLWENEWKWGGVINALLNRRRVETTKNKMWETILSILTSDLLAGSTFQGFLFRLLGRLCSQCKRSAPEFNGIKPRPSISRQSRLEGFVLYHSGIAALTEVQTGRAEGETFRKQHLRCDSTRK